MRVVVAGTGGVEHRAKARDELGQTDLVLGSVGREQELVVKEQGGIHIVPSPMGIMKRFNFSVPSMLGLN